MDHVQTVIIGGGIVGCSVLYGLAKLGWTDTLLLERRELTSGSTWHAAGNVTYFGHYPSITGLYVNSIKTYLAAEAESGHGVGFHAAGSLRLATTAAELESYKRLEPLYEKMGVPYQVVTPKEIADIHPLLVTEGLFGAAHTPTDGHVDPSGATYALAKAAKARGAKIKTRCPVIDLNRTTDGWQVETEDGIVQADNVVIAASFWARELAAKIGLSLPLYPLEHHEVVSGTVRELVDLGREVPTVRDPYAPSNTRQERDGYLCGVYEANPKPWAVDGIPKDFIEELLPPDLERLEPHLLKVMERIPSFGTAGIKTVNNGPICYTPDGCPLLGPVEGERGLWLASGFCIGIGTGGGSGEYLAQWMVNGAPEYELPIVDPARFSKKMTQQECIERIVRTYAAGYGSSDREG